MHYILLFLLISFSTAINLILITFSEGEDLIANEEFNKNSENTVNKDILNKNIKYSFFVDTYSGHDFHESQYIRKTYLTQPVHEDQVNLNLAYIDGTLSTDNYRGRIALQTGDSVVSNYLSENDLFWRYIQECSFGYKINEDLWIDGGIYLSHIGAESFISGDNINYTRSLVAEFSPYYETGVKLNYNINKQTTLQLHLLKGWQNISNKEDPAFGGQIAYSASESVQLIYSNFVGNIDGERIFNDFVFKWDITPKLSLATQYDIGIQSDPIDDKNLIWNGYTLMTRYKFTPKISVGGRVEQFSDPKQAIVSTINNRDFKAVGLSINLDVELIKNLVWRNEFRSLIATQEIFPSGNDYSKNDNFITTSLSFKL